MRLDELDFPLPEELIAREPSARRGDARLLAVRCAAGAWSDRRFDELPELLSSGDLLVLNDTRVVPARLELRKATGGRVEGLWLDASGAEATLMLSGGRLRPGVVLCAEDGTELAELTESRGRGLWSARSRAASWPELLEAYGTPPLPPYVRRLRREAGRPEIEEADRARYQTVFAGPPGSVAAPTASLHFTPELFARLDAAGIARTHLTLHVGPGTFLPIETDDVRRHAMHGERFEVGEEAARALSAARSEGRRVIAVGTTVCRVLESLPTTPEACRGVSELFLLPGRRFRWVDGLLTNFHTPRSTLLALVAAFARHAGGGGLDLVRKAYRHAVASRYQFYSYGDSSLWLR